MNRLHIILLLKEQKKLVNPAVKLELKKAVNPAIKLELKKAVFPAVKLELKKEGLEVDSNPFALL